MHSPETFPKGNAQVGDIVWWKRGRTWDKKWTVVEVGRKNRHGYYLDFVIQRPGVKKGDRPIRRTVSSGIEGLYILPRLVPEGMHDLITKLPRTVVAVRAGGNSDEERCALLCTRCMQVLNITRTEETVAELRWCPPGTVETKKEAMVDSSERVTCGCKQGRPDITVEALNLREVY